MRLIYRMIILAVLLLMLGVGLLFSVQNDAAASLHFFGVSLPEWSVAAWVLIGFALGGVVGVLVSIFDALKLKSELRLLSRKYERCEKMLGELRTVDNKG